MFVLGIAMVPTFGLLTGGVVRTDVAASYENATSIASSILNTLLSTSVTFQELETAAPTAVGTRHPGPPSQPNLLGDLGTAPDKYYLVGRIRYYPDLWVGFYPITGTQEVSFRYFTNPQVDYETDPSHIDRFFRAPVLDNTDYSPYNSSIPDSNLMDQAKVKWATAQAEKVDRVADLGAVSGQRHLAKVVLRIRWGDEDFKGVEGVRGQGKSISLCTLKARLE